MSTKDLVIGNGITALVAGYLLDCPVVRTRVKLPPVGSYLHDTVATRGLLSRLGIAINPTTVRHQVYLNGTLYDWPGPPEAMANHFLKTRNRKLEVIPEYDAAKRRTVETSLIGLRDLWGHLNEVVDVTQARSLRVNLGEVVIDRCRVPVEGQIVLTDNPINAGIPYAHRNPVMVNRTFWDVEACPAPSFVYLADLDTPVFRIQRVDATRFAVEQAYRPGAGQTPSRRVGGEALQRVFPGIKATPLDWRPDPVDYIGFSDGIDMDLPEYVWPLGRAATGKSVSLHHVVEEISHKLALEETPIL